MPPRYDSRCTTFLLRIQLEQVVLDLLNAVSERAVTARGDKKNEESQTAAKRNCNSKAKEASEFGVATCDAPSEDWEHQKYGKKYTSPWIQLLVLQRP